MNHDQDGCGRGAGDCSPPAPTTGIGWVRRDGLGAGRRRRNRKASASARPGFAAPASRAEPIGDAHHRERWRVRGHALAQPHQRRGDALLGGVRADAERRAGPAKLRPAKNRSMSRALRRREFIHGGTTCERTDAHSSASAASTASTAASASESIPSPGARAAPARNRAPRPDAARARAGLADGCARHGGRTRGRPPGRHRRRRHRPGAGGRSQRPWCHGVDDGPQALFLARLP